jgi:hypothetical protein
LRRVVILQFIRRNELSQLGPATVAREFAAERQKEVFERELMTMLGPIQVENSGPPLGSNRPFCAHFTVKNFSHPLRHNRSGLIQGALNNFFVAKQEAKQQPSSRILKKPATQEAQSKARCANEGVTIIQFYNCPHKEA